MLPGQQKIGKTGRGFRFRFSLGVAATEVDSTAAGSAPAVSDTLSAGEAWLKTGVSGRMMAAVRLRQIMRVYAVRLLIELICKMRWSLVNSRGDISCQIRRALRAPNISPNDIPRLTADTDCFQEFSIKKWDGSQSPTPPKNTFR